MSERDGSSSHHHHHDPPKSTLVLLKQVLLDSLKIILRNPQTFLSIFALTTLPLSLLLFSLSLSSHPIKSHVYHLESLASQAPTRFEARQVWKESRDDAVSLLLRIKLLYFLPSYLLSLLASLAAVTAASSAFHGKAPTLRSSLAAVKSTWHRPFATSICVYALLIAYALVPRTLALAFASPGSRLLVRLLGSGLEIYLMAVTGLALVVSILEERFGWDAIRVGSGLMVGKRMCGWVLSGLLVMITAVIARKLEEVMDGQDLMERSSTGTMTRVVVGIGDKFGLKYIIPAEVV
uniref:uncharacterized protein LOC101315033 isoform X2 n=1 Tax=Fragaria vesca subsp. vesca TaxID=101020 RepID=UPI0005C81DC7|nr:PREDICTED: uncharacterized protein LOC101315033 isoform X2 [Fragaria vesca subsp. vesca]